MENAKSSKKPFALSAAVGILLVGLVFSFSMQGATFTVLGIGSGTNQINSITLNVKSPSGTSVNYTITSSANTTIQVTKGSILESIVVQANADYSYLPAGTVPWYTARCNVTIYNPLGEKAYHHMSPPVFWNNNSGQSRWEVGFPQSPYLTMDQGSWTIEIIFYSIA